MTMFPDAVYFRGREVGLDHHKPQEWLEFSRPASRVEASPNVGVGARRVMLQPTEAMQRARAWLETIKTPPEPDASLLAMNGWLCPEGHLYACAWQKHDPLTHALGFKHQSEIEEAGYCKLSRLEWLVEPRYRTQPLTAAQWQTISRWYETNGYPVEHYLRLTLRV